MEAVSVVMIVKDEEKKLERALQSVKWADEIIVIDGGSRDGTVRVAKRFTSKVFQRVFDDFSSQKNFAMEQAKGEWILSLDADEIVDKRLGEAIQRTVRAGSESNGFRVRRTNYLFGRPLRFAGQGSEKILRLFRQGKGRFVQPIHETIHVEGKVGELSGTLIHYSSSTVSEYLEKLRLYTDLEVNWLAETHRRPGNLDFFIKPAAFFINNYILRLGFLDGYEGFLYHALSSFNQAFKSVCLAEASTCKDKSADSFSS